MDFSQSPVTLALIAANVLFSLIGFTAPGFMNKTVGWPYYQKRNGQHYRVLTSGFLHADFIHLFFNMFTLYYFGGAIEFLFTKHGLGGNTAYLTLYFAGLIVSDLPNYIKHRDDPEYRSLGASGAVSAVLFAAIVFNPWGEILLYGAIGLSAALFAVLYIIYCVYMGKQSRDNVNHDAHLWGAVFGLAFTIVLVAVQQPELFDKIIIELKNPSLLGR